MTPIVIKSSAKSIFGAIALATVLLIAITYFLYTRQFEPPELYALYLFPLAIDLLAVSRLVKLQMRRMILSEDMLRLEEGMVSKTQRSMMLTKIQDVQVDQSAGQRLWGVGNLLVQAAGDALPVRMENVDRPRQVADAILNAARSSRKLGTHD